VATVADYGVVISGQITLNAGMSYDLPLNFDLRCV